MSAQPSHERPVRRSQFADLRRINAAIAKEDGLLALRDVSYYVKATPTAIKTWLDAIEAEPVGIISNVSATVGVLLYTATDATDAVKYARNQGYIAQRHGNGPVVRIGTRTPTAGRPYEWRDSDRSKGAPSMPVPVDTPTRSRSIR